MVKIKIYRICLRTQFLWDKIAPAAKWMPIPLWIYVENNWDSDPSNEMISWLWFSDGYKPVFEGPNRCKGKCGSANKGFQLGIIPGIILTDSEYGDSHESFISKRTSVNRL